MLICPQGNIKAADKSGMIKVRSRRYNKGKQATTKLPWFDNDCKNKRKRFQLLKCKVGKDKNNNALHE
jgi:hypothetical protein